MSSEASASLPDFVAPGTDLDGRYVVERLIGQGGAGVVAAAQHVTLRRRVALKFLRAELVHNADVGKRFLREARALAQLRSDHVAKVLDAGTFSSGRAYIALEYLDGEDLSATVKKRGALGVAESADYLLQACEGVAEAHALGILHRDLKPANLFLTRGPDGLPFVKVLDFGLSKLLTVDPTASVSESNHLLGSPHFMSPEQMRCARDIDARTDIWALGVTLFTLLSGRVPFEGERLVEVCTAVLTRPCPQLRRLRPDVPQALEALVQRCLALEPTDRYQNIAELVIALAPLAPARCDQSVQRILRMNRAAPAVAATAGARLVQPAELALPSVGSLPCTPQLEKSSAARLQRGRLRRSLVVCAGLVAGASLSVIFGPAHLPWRSSAKASGPSGASVSHVVVPAKLLAAQPLPADSVPTPGASAATLATPKLGKQPRTRVATAEGPPRRATPQRAPLPKALPTSGQLATHSSAAPAPSQGRRTTVSDEEWIQSLPH